jgi:hypothetical protein
MAIKSMYAKRIAKTLGLETANYVSIISSVAVTVASIFYIFTIGSYFKVSIHVLQNRVTYDTFFPNIYIVNRYADHLIIASGTFLWLVLNVDGKLKFVIAATYAGVILLALSTNYQILLDLVALLSIPLIISLLLYNRFSTKKILKKYENLFINYIAVVGIGLAIISIIISVEQIVFYIPPTSNSLRNYAYDIFLIFSSLSEIMLFLLIFSVPLKMLMLEFINRLPKIKKDLQPLFPSDIIRVRAKIVYLVLFMMLSIIVALIPHQPTINKGDQLVGVDTHFYVEWVTALNHTKNLQDFLEQAFVIQSSHGDRPVTLIVFFTIAKVVKADLFYLFDRLPILLGPILVLVVYFLTRELISKDDTTPLLASFLTAISFQTLGGIYAGYYANWLALIFGYTCIVFLFRFLKRSGELNFIIFSVSAVLLLFSHVYTWSILVIAMGLFLGVMLKMKYYPKKRVILLLLVIISSIAIDLTKTTITGSTGGIERDIYLAKKQEVGLTQFVDRWNNLLDVTHHYFGGIFGNFIILMLALYWVFRCSLSDVHAIFLIVFMSVAIMPLFFGDRQIQIRVLYDTPFQIPAALGLAHIKKSTNGTLLWVSICIWLVAISVRDVSNFYYVAPS